MSLEFELIAGAMQDIVVRGRSRCTISLDVGQWSQEELRGFIDALRSRVRVKGVRTDTAGFNKFGINPDTLNSGMYAGVPIVMTERVDFDVAEFVIEPLPQQ